MSTDAMVRKYRQFFRERYGRESQLDDDAIRAIIRTVRDDSDVDVEDDARVGAMFEKEQAQGSVFLQPKNTMPEIFELWAVVSVDVVDGNEGIVAAEFPGMGWLPLIASDQTRLEQFMPIAEHIAKSTRMQLRIVHFSKDRVEKEILP